MKNTIREMEDYKLTLSVEQYKDQDLFHVRFDRKIDNSKVGGNYFEMFLTRAELDIIKETL